MEIRGIQSLEIETQENGDYRVYVEYTEEFVSILRKILNKKNITDEEVVEFIKDSLDL